jgi:hypothetical protein
MTGSDLFDSSADAAERRGCHAPPSSSGDEVARDATAGIIGDCPYIAR